MCLKLDRSWRLLPSQVESEPVTVKKVGTGENAETKQHIRGLLEDVREHSPHYVRDKAVRLSTEFADVLGTTDIDLGSLMLLNIKLTLVMQIQ